MVIAVPTCAHRLFGALSRPGSRAAIHAFCRHTDYLTMTGDDASAVVSIVARLVSGSITSNLTVNS